MKIIDLGEKSDYSELESKSEDESHPRTNIEPKVSVPEEIKEKGRVETESSVQQEIKEKQDVEPESSVQ